MTQNYFMNPIMGEDQGGFMNNARTAAAFKVGENVLVIRFTQYKGLRAFVYGKGIYTVTKVTKNNVFINVYDENEDKILTASNKFNKFGVRMKRHNYPYKYKEFYVLYTKEIANKRDIMEQINDSGYHYHSSEQDDIQRLYNKVSEL